MVKCTAGLVQKRDAEEHLPCTSPPGIPAVAKIIHSYACFLAFSEASLRTRKNRPRSCPFPTIHVRRTGGLGRAVDPYIRISYQPLMPNLPPPPATEEVKKHKRGIETWPSSPKKLVIEQHSTAAPPAFVSAESASSLLLLTIHRYFQPIKMSEDWSMQPGFRSLNEDGPRLRS